MKVYIVKSPEMSAEVFTKTVELLNAIPGAISFYFDKDSVINIELDEVKAETIADESGFVQKNMLNVQYNRLLSPHQRHTTSWQSLFSKCQSYRLQHNIANNDFVILLTDIANERNWFASLDENMPFNGFIHTDEWPHYIDCPAEFPIAYEVVALMLQKFMFNDIEDLRSTVHNIPVGCVNDMCVQKKEVILKLRTADICRNCMSKIKDILPAHLIYHALQIMESLRLKMLYAQNFRQESPVSTLHINQQNKIFLPDFGNIEIRLRPLEKALYFLYLNHPDGIYLSSLSEHRKELYDIYSKMSSMGMLHEIRARIDDMTNALSNSASEKLSRIKRVFEEAIGHELAKNYYICGNVGASKSISLSREKIIKDIEN